MKMNTAKKMKNSVYIEPVVPTKSYNQLPEHAFHLLSASEVLQKYGVETQYITDARQLQKVVKELMMVETIFGLDIETAKLTDYKEHEGAGLDPYLSRIRLVQLYFGTETVYVFDMNACNMKTLLPVLESRKFVAHNAIFELKHLIHAGVNLPNMDCTMLMGNALRNKNHKLSLLVEACLKISISKELQASDWSNDKLTADQIAYAACDAVLVYKLYPFLKRLILQYSRENIYSLMYHAQREIAKLELNGFVFDMDAHTALISQWDDKQKQGIIALKKQVGGSINLNSGKQLSDWLMVNLSAEDLKKMVRTPTGQLKTTMDALSKIPNHPLIEPLRRYKKYNKLISSFGKSYSKFVNPVTGRLHGAFSLAGTTTGRFACYKPNIQNPPRAKDFRGLFKASPGYVIVVADYGQMQLRIAALLSQDKKMLQAYKEGIDLHKMTAAAVAGVKIEEVTKEQRHMAKAVNFGFIFGQGVKSFKAKTEADYGILLSYWDAKRSRDAFFDTYSGLKQWQEKTAKRAERNNVVVTTGGRTRDFSRESKGFQYAEALNTPVQGAEAEVILAVLSLLEKYMTGIDAKLVNIVHDEFVFEVVQADKDKALVAVEAVMVAGMLQIFPEASTLNLVDAHAGDNWADAK